MAKNWTKTQLKAIETTDRTLLISAGAGSGKTTVLIERILRSILREDPVGVDEMLVVTYTRAAAQELRDRLGEEIKNALKNNPENEKNISWNKRPFLTLESLLNLQVNAKISGLFWCVCAIFKFSSHFGGCLGGF